jgi:Zn-dependent M28 family amino/carboxypeptidase
MPGANDNASGVAIAMEVMRALKEFAAPLKRSVVVVAFGAEEQAVVGSEVYLQRPPFPLKNATGLLNLDGVGVGNRISALGGKNFPALFTAMENANNTYVHRPLQASEFMNITRPRLDAARFEKAGIPVLSFSTGGIPSVYHLPGDRPENLTPEIMEDLARIIYAGIIELADR